MKLPAVVVTAGVLSGSFGGEAGLVAWASVLTRALLTMALSGCTEEGGAASGLGGETPPWGALVFSSTGLFTEAVVFTSVLSAEGGGSGVGPSNGLASSAVTTATGKGLEALSEGSSAFPWPLSRSSLLASVDEEERRIFLASLSSRSVC